MARPYGYIPVDANARPIVRFGDSPARWPVRAAVRVFDGPTERGIAVHVAGRRVGNDRTHGGWLAVDPNGRTWPTLYPTQFAVAEALRSGHGAFTSSCWDFTWPAGRPVTTIVGV